MREFKKACLFLPIVLLLSSRSRGMGEQSTNQPSGRPPPEEMREQLKSLSPEERRAKLNEWRQQGGPLEPFHSERTNPPARDPADIQRAQAMRGTNAPNFAARTARLKARRDELERKRAEGSLTPAEQAQLERIDALMKHEPIAPLRIVPPTNPPSATPTPKTDAK